MHQNEWFQDWFFQNFLGRGSPSPVPRPLPPFYLGLSPSIRASPSILGRFAPSTRTSPSILGRFAPSIRASPSTFDWRSWFGPPPQSKFLDPPVSTWSFPTCKPTSGWACFPSASSSQFFSFLVYLLYSIGSHEPYQWMHMVIGIVPYVRIYRPFTWSGRFNLTSWIIISVARRYPVAPLAVMRRPVADRHKFNNRILFFPTIVHSIYRREKSFAETRRHDAMDGRRRHGRDGQYNIMYVRIHRMWPSNHFYESAPDWHLPVK